MGSASLLLEYLGIDEPQDIDVEAIAQACQATVHYDELSGCEARLVGWADRAIILVNEAVPRPRQRFSVAHELGHWVRDRGKIAFACGDAQMSGEWGADRGPEVRANRYAADLLLPRPMFKRYARDLPPTFVMARELAETFQTSITATALRLVQLNSFPALLLCHRQGRTLWSVASPHLPRSLRPRPLVRPVPPSAGLVEVRADRYIDHPTAGRYRLHVGALAVAGELALNLLWWRDEAQILAVAGEHGWH